MANQNRNLEFFQDVLEIVDWMNGGSMEDWSSISGNLIVTKLQKDVSFAQVRVERVEEELSELKRDKELLIQKLGQQETEIDKLKKELVKEKWETCDAKVNTKEMAKEVARLYWKIGDLVEKINTGDVGEENEDVQLIEDEEEGPVRKRNKWGVGGDGGEVATKEALNKVRTQVEDKMKKLEKDRNETKMELASTNQFVENINTLVQKRTQEPTTEFPRQQTSQEYLTVEKSSPTISLQEAIELSIPEPHQAVNDPGPNSPLNSFPMVSVESGSLILDQLRKEEEEASTLTLTFHRSSPSPPSDLEYPPQQIEFFHKLLGFPENKPETPIATVVSPKLSPMARELVASPATSTVSTESVPALQSPQIPVGSKADEEEDNKEIYHATDPSKRHLGYFCLCGLECSTKKTLQFHLQYLQSNTSSSSSSSNGAMETETITQINMIPVQNHPPQNEPRATLKIKKCKRCGDSYTGGKEGLRQHNLLHHNTRSQQPYSSPPLNDVIPHPHNNFTCAYCPEIFRTMVQLRLHHKVKHTPSNSNQLNHLSTGYLNE